MTCSGAAVVNTEVTTADASDGLLAEAMEQLVDRVQRKKNAAFDELLKMKRIPRDIPFYVSVPSATDPDLAPAGCNVIFVLVPMPLLSEMKNNLRTKRYA